MKIVSFYRRNKDENGRGNELKLYFPNCETIYDYTNCEVHHEYFKINRNK